MAMQDVLAFFEAAREDPMRSICGVEALTLLLSRMLLKNEDIDERTFQATVLTYPSWMSTDTRLWCARHLAHSSRARDCFGEAALSVCLWGVALRSFPNDWQSQCFRFFACFSACVVVSLHHAARVAATRNRTHYLRLYNMWLTLILEHVLKVCGVSCRSIWVGTVTHLFVSTGSGKLRIGGLKWFGADTLRTYLGGYDASRPVCPWLNGWLRRDRAASQAMLRILSVVSVAMEVFIVPALLVCDLSPTMRRTFAAFAPVWPPITSGRAAILMLGLFHAGTSLVMDWRIGPSFFLGCLGAYVLAAGLYPSDHEGVDVGGLRSVLFASLVGYGPTVASLLLRGALLPEDWPLTSFHLFSFCGEHWRLIKEGRQLLKDANRIPPARWNMDEGQWEGVPDRLLHR